jgi:hypothetical protein
LGFNAIHYAEIPVEEVEEKGEKTCTCEMANYKRGWGGKLCYEALRDST